MLIPIGKAVYCLFVFCLTPFGAWHIIYLLSRADALNLLLVNIYGVSL